LLETECKILQTVEYSIIESSPYRFLERFSKIAKADAEVFSIAQCLLEMALFDSKMNQYAPSMQAAAAIYMALRITMKQDESTSAQENSNLSCWTKPLQAHTKYPSWMLKPCAQKMVQLASAMRVSEFQMIKKKFGSSKHGEVIKTVNRVLRSSLKA
jgi:transcription initiation factor TFIIIB Brf1 subunit/transcription initiation factor TFIIB